MKTSFLKDRLDEILIDNKILLEDTQRQVLVTIRDKLDSENKSKFTFAELKEIGISLLKLMAAGSDFLK